MGLLLPFSNFQIFWCRNQYLDSEIVLIPLLKKSGFSAHWLDILFNYHIRTGNILHVGSRFMTWRCYLVQCLKASVTNLSSFRFSIQFALLKSEKYVISTTTQFALSVVLFLFRWEDFSHFITLIMNDLEGKKKVGQFLPRNVYSVRILQVPTDEINGSPGYGVQHVLTFFRLILFPLLLCRQSILIICWRWDQLNDVQAYPSIGAWSIGKSLL